MTRLSLRTRLVAVAVALVAFAVTMVGVATWVALRGYLYDRVDRQVVDLAGNPGRAVCLPQGGPGQQTTDRTTHAAYVNGAGAVGSFTCGPGGYPLARQLDVPAGDAAWMSRLTEPTDPFTLTSGGGRYRVVAVPTSVLAAGDPDGTDAGGAVVLGLATDDADATLSRLLWLSVLIGAVAVVGTAVVGTVGVRLGLRPLDRVTRTARTVAAELGPDGRGLQNRVPDADPRTEVGQLAEAVNTMLGAVEQEYAARYASEQRLRRFLADASHELRTPLTSLRGYAELVRMRGGLDPDATDSLRRIETEGTRMGGLVEDLLTLARSDRGELAAAERAPVDVSEVLDDAVAGVRAAHPDRPVEVAGSGPLPVVGDRDQLLQVVTNVLTNAAVHATAPGPVRVSAGREGAEVVVRVADAGPGLPPEQAAQVFERFWRADAARTRVRGGSGLGLSIVQALVADHGGRVGFESSVATGTTVTVRLPASPVPADPAPAGSVAPAPGETGKASLS